MVYKLVINTPTSILQNIILSVCFNCSETTEMIYHLSVLSDIRGFVTIFKESLFHQKIFIYFVLYE